MLMNQRTMAVTSLGFLIVSFSAAMADEAGVRKYRDFTPEQIRELPEKVRNSELPMMYTFAAQTGLAPDAEVLFSMQLNTLMYPGLHDYRAAVRAFQSDLGDKPTGVLTVWQIHSLQKRYELQKLAPVSFPDRMTSANVGSYAYVQGTMIIVDDKIAWPVNQTRISCFKDEGTCESRQVILVLPDDKSWVQQYQVMSDAGETFRITRWERNNIDAVSVDTGTECRSRSLNLDFKTKEFYYVTRNAGGDCKVLGKEMPKLQKPRIAQIVEGKKAIEEEFAKLHKAAYDSLSSEFRKRVEAPDAKETKK